jgi:hypothetical protein
MGAEMHVGRYRGLMRAWLEFWVFLSSSLMNMNSAGRRDCSLDELHERFSNVKFG